MSRGVRSLLALVTLTWPLVAPLVRVELPASGPSALAALGLSGHWLRLAVAVAALWLIAGPLALYVVLRGERP